jgi:hypothetical protein
MLKTSFEPLPDAEFRKLVASGVAKPGQQGTALFVAKWRDGPGLDPEAFLVALRAQGSSLEVRRYRDDVNIRVIRSPPAAPGGKRPPAERRKSPA